MIRPSGQRQNVVAQPLDEGADTAGQVTRSAFGLPCQRQFSDKSDLRSRLTRAAELGLQLLAPRRGTLGEPRQRVGEAFAPADDVKDIAMARRVAPSGLLPGAQTLPGIGDGIIGFQPLLSDVEQMHTPGVGVAVVLRGQKIAIGRFGADTGQNRFSAMEKFIVQPRANAREVLRAVDHAGLLRGRKEHVVNSADADRPAQHVTHELENAEIRHISASATITWRSHLLVT
jgi:hypothetical protein